MAHPNGAPSPRRTIESIDREIEDLEASVSRLARLRHGSLPGIVGMRRTYRAERLIALLLRERAALKAGGRGSVDVSRRELAAARPLALSVKPRPDHQPEAPSSAIRSRRT
jgi:hypothetical protein